MSGPGARVLAQAKVNLALRVLARERSGYHQLETIFCRLELADLVTVRIADSSRSLDCRGPMLPSGGLGPVDGNLAYRAAVLFAAEASWPRGFAIEIEKRIPVGGGLGGGSADAGAVLRALNALAPRPLPVPVLLALAARLGADVPFLTTEGALALGWGRGERLLALPALPPRDVALLVPAVAIATKDAYSWLADGLTVDAPLVSVWELADLRSWERIAAISANDFERVVFARFPSLAGAHASLAGRDGVVMARLAGSGSTVFAVCEPQVRAAAAPIACELAAHDAEQWRGLDTRTADRVAAIELD